jgi:hypothetical protein
LTLFAIRVIINYNVETTLNYKTETGKLQMKIIENMKLNEMNLKHTTYIDYARQYDIENGTHYSDTITQLHHERLQREREREQYEREQNAPQTVTYNNGTQRNIIGNYNNNETMIEKSFNHLNSLKRALTLSHQSDDETTRMFHENIMYRELFALELSLRTMKTNIKKNN